MNCNRPVTHREWVEARGSWPYGNNHEVADDIVQARLVEAEKEIAARDAKPAAKPDKPVWTVADELGCIADIPCRLVGPCMGELSWDVIEITRSGGGVMQFRSREAAFNYVSDVTLVQPNDRRAYMIVPSTRKALDSENA